MTTLISDGGSMVVGRRTASYVYGAFEVTLVDGLEQAPAEDDRIADAYIYRPDDRGHGRGELTFVRADARIDMNAVKSDLEDTLDQASRRVDGAIFYSRELRGKSLGRTLPGADYVVGSVIDLLHWGKRISLPVTGISDLSTPVDGHHHAVQVGGQALTDAEKLRKITGDLDNQIAMEKRQRLKDVGEVSRKAGQAQSTADGVRWDLESTEVQAVEEGWFPPSGGWQGAVETLNRNFLEFRTFQTDTNAELQARIEAHGQMIADLQEAKRKALAETSRSVYVDRSLGTASDHDGKFVKVTIDGKQLRVQALGAWHGTIIINAICAVDVDTVEQIQPYQHKLDVPSVEFGGDWSVKPSSISFRRWESAVATANIRPGTMIDRNLPISSVRVNEAVWHTIKTFRTTRAGEHTIMATVGWHATTYEDTYGLRLLIGSQVVAEIAPRTRVGPLGPWGNGYVKWVLDVRDREIPAGTDIKLEAWSGADLSDQRTIRDGGLRVWWIEQE